MDENVKGGKFNTSISYGLMAYAYEVWSIKIKINYLITFVKIEERS